MLHAPFSEIWATDIISSMFKNSRWDRNKFILMQASQWYVILDFYTLILDWDIYFKIWNR